jgi:crotonobetainyl-CoA:carnitine CoA-transferase CaiB-like acyl-CoA transferase
VVCDFSDPADLQRLRDLIDQADVVVENFKVGGLKKFGMDYETLAERNPRLIYASITGFGQTGPRAKQPGYDGLIQGLCGIMDLTGEPDGEPQKVGVAWIDIFTGLYAVIAIQAALAERGRSGLGQSLDLSLLDTGVAVLANQSMNYLLGGKLPRRSGNVHPNIFPYQLFAASDGHVFLACGNDGQFRALCRALDLNTVAEDPRYAHNADRLANRDVLLPILQQAFATRTRAEVIGAVENAGVPIGPINSVAEALADEQVIARGMQIAPEGVRGLRTPIKFSRSKMQHAKAAPTLGNGAWRFETD